MRTILLNRGAPGSGKSFFLKQNNLEAYTLSADSIRLLVQSPILFPDGSLGISQKNDRRVWELLMQLVEERMERQEFIIVDATHSKSSDFAKYKKLAEIYRYRIYCVDFGDVSLDTCLVQNKARENYKFVPEDVIRNLHTRIQTQPVPNYVKIIKPNEINSVLEYTPLDFNKYTRIRILGDIHSSYEPVKEYFEKYPLLETDYLISVGDLFDRNDQSAEIMQWWLSMFDRPNVCLLQSNHGVHFNNWAFGQPIKSDVFKFETLVQLQKAGFTDREARSIARKEAQFAYFSFNNNIYFVNHGGIPCLPEKLALLAGQSLIKGIGKYEEVDQVCDSWNMLTNNNVYQIFGHRSTGENMPIQRGRTFRLESKIEFGGFLTALHISAEGHEIIQIKNNHFCIKPSVDQIKVPKTNEELIEVLRSSKDIYECKVTSPTTKVASF